MGNVERLEQLYDQVDTLKSVVARATLTELVRDSQGGLTDQRIEYWTARLSRLIADHAGCAGSGESFGDSPDTCGMEGSETDVIGGL